MSTPKDGGPIGPDMISLVQISPDTHMENKMIAKGGLSIRDWFAGMALPACFSAPCPAAWVAGSMEHREQSAAASYMMADAMLAARERKEEP